MRLFRTTYLLRALTALLVTLLSGCVTETLDECPPANVNILVSHSTDWTRHEMTVSRAGGSPLARYHLMVTPAGNTAGRVYEEVFTSPDLDRADFTHTLPLSPGDYDIFLWSDYADADKGTSLFFDTSDFSSIYYPEPYTGNDERRDAFRGQTSVHVAPTVSPVTNIAAGVDMERPFARYEFVATDFAEFIDNEITKGEAVRFAEVRAVGLTEDGAPTPFSAVRVTEDGAPTPFSAVDRSDAYSPLEGYRVRMLYTGYMPSKFDNFLNRPVDSRTGMEYDSQIQPLSGEEARLGFDYVMVNGHESSVQVALEVYNPQGQLIGRTSTIEVPTRRGRDTTVRGKFLTSSASGGVGINPGFNGDFNIEIR